MAGKVKIGLLTGDYEITRALKEGLVEVDGIEIEMPKFPGTRTLHVQMNKGEHVMTIEELFASTAA
jgi:hypothetical protein